MVLSPQLTENARAGFLRDGYAILPKLVSSQQLTKLREQLLGEFVRAKQAGELFAGGGMVSGHLNCFPGAQSRFVLEALHELGVIDLVRELSPQAKRMPNIGCNMNLPGSSAQNYHIDGYASQSFMIVNVAPVDTTVINGALEVSPRSHLRDYKYHQFRLSRNRPVRMDMNAGDVLLRSSALWHRGMPNRSEEIRPMLGFTWEEGGSPLADPYSIFDGKIRFLQNRYTTDLSGRLREYAFAKLPAVGEGYLLARSVFRR